MTDLQLVGVYLVAIGCMGGAWLSGWVIRGLHERHRARKKNHEQ